MPRNPTIGGGGGGSPRPGSQEWLNSYGHLVGYQPYVPGGGAPAPGGGAPGGFTNTAEADPDLSGQLDRLKKRMDDPEGSTGRAVAKAGSDIRDATEGRRAALRGMMAGRGVLGGSSVPELTEAALMDDEARGVNKAASDIRLGRERDNDAFMLSATGAFTSAAGLKQGDRRLGLDQYLGTRGLDMQAQQFQQQQQRSDLQDLLAILGSF